MSITRRILVALVPLSLILSACNAAPAPTNTTAHQGDLGGDGGAMVSAASSGTIKVAGDGGTMVAGKSLPSIWPSDVPTYANATILYSGGASPADGKPGVYVMSMTPDSAQTVHDFFVTALQAQGWTVKSTFVTTDSQALEATKDGRMLGISLATSEGQTAITLAVELQAK